MQFISGPLGVQTFPGSSCVSHRCGPLFCSLFTWENSMKTWDVLELGMTPTGTISLCCPECGEDAEMPISKPASPVIAAIGLGLIFDNPTYVPKGAILPTTIKCRTCHRVFSSTTGDKT